MGSGKSDMSAKRGAKSSKNNTSAKMTIKDGTLIVNEKLIRYWEKIIKKLPEANFLQSPKYGIMNQLTGARVFVSDFGGLGWALMIRRDAKRGRYLEIPCGPLIDWGDEATVQEAMREINAIARREKCAFARMRPQLPMTAESLKLLEGLGLRKSPMHLAAEHTVMINLDLSKEELMAKMRRQTRYEVRRADKLGIKVAKSNSEAIFKEFCRVQGKTARRQGFVPPSLRVLMAEREAFSDDIMIYKATTGEASIEQAPDKTPSTEEGEAIAYGMIIRGGKEADYYEAASTELNRKLPGAYALLWQAILDAKKAGYARFNLWGIAPAGQPHHRYAGVTTFKTGFPGEIVEFVPAHDMIISKVGYLKDYIVEAARKKRRRL